MKTLLEIITEEVVYNFNHAKENFEEKKAEFVKGFEKNPEYTLRWSADDMMKAQFTFTTWQKYKHMIERDLDSSLTIVDTFEEELDMDSERILKGWEIEKSTSMVSNALSIFKSEAIGNVILEMRYTLRRSKREFEFEKQKQAAKKES